MPHLLAEGFYDRVIMPYSDYLKKKHDNFKFVWREAEFQKLIRLLFLPDHNSVILTGPPGVGRRSLIQGLVLNQTSDHMPSEIVSRPFYRLNVNVLFASCTAQSVENKLIEAIDELKRLYQRRSMKPILVIDDGANFVNNIMRSQHHNLINILINADSVINCLDIILSLDEESRRELKDAFPTFYCSFSEQKVEPPCNENLIKILREQLPYYKQRKLNISNSVLNKVVDITTRYPSIFDFSQPKRSIRLLDESAVAYMLEMHRKPRNVPALESEILSLEVSGGNEEKTTILKIKIEEEYRVWKAEKIEIRNFQDQICEFESLIYEKKKEITKREKESDSKLDKIAEQGREELVVSAVEGKREYSQGKSASEFKLMSNKDILKFLKVDSNIHKDPLISPLNKDIHRYESGISQISDKITEKLALLNYDISLPVDFVESVAGQITRLPIGGVGGGMEKRLINGEDELNKVVLGQEKMIKPVLTSLKIAATGGNDTDKPLGAFLILGPSGVGKTFLAEQIANMLFDSPDFLTTINMENYIKDHTVSSLIGAPPGYAGFGTPGLLVSTAQEKPYSVLLLDEIEKAHKDVKQSLLTCLDKGYMKGLDGVSASLKNIIIMATSNYGQDILLQPGIDYEEAKEKILHRIYRDPEHFSTEFLNRVTILFADFLSPESIVNIGLHEVDKLQKRYQQKNPDFKIQMNIDSVKNLVRANYDKENGARLIQAIIKDKIGGEASDIILDERQRNGKINGVLVVTCDEVGVFQFNYSSC